MNKVLTDVPVLSGFDIDDVATELILRNPGFRFIITTKQGFRMRRPVEWPTTASMIERFIETSPFEAANILPYVNKRQCECRLCGFNSNETYLIAFFSSFFTFFTNSIKVKLLVNNIQTNKFGGIWTWKFLILSNIEIIKSKIFRCRFQIFLEF